MRIGIHSPAHYDQLVSFFLLLRDNFLSSSSFTNQNSPYFFPVALYAVNAANKMTVRYNKDSGNSFFKL